LQVGGSLSLGRSAPYRGAGAAGERPEVGSITIPTTPTTEVAMKVIVDFDRCESNAVCMGIAPDVFEVRDDDFLYILQEEPPEAMRPKMEEAVRLCPKQAISIEG
jgi:ferredoxin